MATVDCLLDRRATSSFCLCFSFLRTTPPLTLFFSSVSANVFRLWSNFFCNLLLHPNLHVPLRSSSSESLPRQKNTTRRSNELSHRAALLPVRRPLWLCTANVITKCFRRGKHLNQITKLSALSQLIQQSKAEVPGKVGVCRKWHSWGF